jgi:hypothetical protein
VEQRPPTKKEIIDWIIAKATMGMFVGDKRDGEPPPITIKNFTLETQRYGAKAFRARLSQLSSAELLTETAEVRAYFEAQPSWLAQMAEQVKQEEAARAHHQRQVERGRRSRLQPAIHAAARHYRAQGMTAGEAWDALNETPFTTDDGHTVEIEGSKLPRLEQRMRARQADGRQQRRAISFEQWRKSYWKGAKPG